FDSDSDEGLIGLEGTEKLCEVLDIDPSDIVTLVLAWHLKCEKPCEFKKEGWLHG
ncbi:hypothetical protein BC829DRAFT_345800, partial [Chytridium lagenaria]